MAHVHSESIVITISKLVKESSQDETTLANDELLASIEAVTQELLGDHIIVEVTKA